jgi:hypothetical protein
MTRIRATIKTRARVMTRVNVKAMTRANKAQGDRRGVLLN